VIHHGVDARFAPGGEERSEFVLYTGDADRERVSPPSGPALPEGVQLRTAGPGLGYVTDEDLLALYRRAAVLVLPSLYEGFGFPLAEAMACGTPCIASDDPALLEVSGGAALHFPRGDAAALPSCSGACWRIASCVTTFPGGEWSGPRPFRWDRCAALHVEVYREGRAVRVALVHDWLTGLRGGERVLEQLCSSTPVRTSSRWCTSRAPPARSSSATGSPRASSTGCPSAFYRRYLPLFPLAIESLDLSDYDLVISTSHSVAKGCKPAPAPCTWRYIHTPMRYVWDQFDAYFGPAGRGSPPSGGTRRRPDAAPLGRRLDPARARADRQQPLSLRSASAGTGGARWTPSVHPPVDTSRFVPRPRGRPGGVRAHRLRAGPLQAHRAGDRSVLPPRAPALDRGRRSERQRLAKAAGPSIRFPRNVGQDELPASTPARASSSCPGRRISHRRGGGAGRRTAGPRAGPRRRAGDRRRRQDRGLLHPADGRIVLEGIAAIDRLQPDPIGIHEEARRFDVARFKPELERAIESCLARARR